LCPFTAGEHLSNPPPPKPSNRNNHNQRAREAGWTVTIAGPEEQRARYGIGAAQPVLALRLPA
jgi:hypothetical protein